jgi:hypothetical protein
MIRLLPALTELRFYCNSGDADPYAGTAQAPVLLLNMRRGRIVSPSDLGVTPRGPNRSSPRRCASITGAMGGMWKLRGWEVKAGWGTLRLSTTAALRAGATGISHDDEATERQKHDKLRSPCRWRMRPPRSTMSPVVATLRQGGAHSIGTGGRLRRNLQEARRRIRDLQAGPLETVPLPMHLVESSHERISHDQERRLLGRHDLDRGADCKHHDLAIGAPTATACRRAGEGLCSGSASRSCGTDIGGVNRQGAGPSEEFWANCRRRCECSSLIRY